MTMFVEWLRAAHDPFGELRSGTLFCGQTVGADRAFKVAFFVLEVDPSLSCRALGACNRRRGYPRSPLTHAISTVLE